MPFTPFHFGPALAIKVAGGRWFSLLAFAAAQVAIDAEAGYNLAQGCWPVHGLLHTYVGSTGVAVGVTLLVAACWLLVHPRLAVLMAGAGRVFQPAGFGHVFAVTGWSALLGAWSHVFLDSLLYMDIRPFAPFWGGNPLLGLVSAPVLYLACAGLGVAGLLLLGVARTFNRRGA
ncbi:MAG: hypothetical protein FJ288_15810 [Planctomycetes bacterium]|nr:hypothetical protein [Planctomycetota bacterium]